MMECRSTMSRMGQIVWAAALTVLVSGAWAGVRPAPPRAPSGEAWAPRRSVIDYYYLLPSVSIADRTSRQAMRELLRPDSHPVIDLRHDYLLVRPDSSPAEQIVVFRSLGGADLIADSAPDWVSDYNGFVLYRLHHGRLRDVTRQVLPVPPRTDRYLYELPRWGTTIRVYRFDLDTETRRHAFDLQWREGRFVKVR